MAAANQDSSTSILFYEEVGGVIVGEAELFSKRTAGSTGAQWTVVPDESPGEGRILKPRGGKYVQLLPDNGTLGSPTIEYKLRIRTTGTYRLFLRWEANPTSVSTSNSLHASVVELKDGVGGQIADNYQFNDASGRGDFDRAGWSGLGGKEQTQGSFPTEPVLWTISKPGTYTLRITQREDGAAVDSFVFQLATLPPPTGSGPPVSATYFDVESPYGNASPASAVEQLLDFAQTSLPAYFPSNQTSQLFQRFRFRFYPETGIYLGVATDVSLSDNLVESGVYVMGGAFGSTPSYQGRLSSFVAPVRDDLEAAPGLSATYLSALPAVPQGSGQPCSNRAAWLSANTRATAMIAQADALLGQPFPAWSDTVYLEATRTGDANNGQAMMNARKSPLYPLVIAECVTWHGKYLDLIRTSLRELAQQPTWNWPSPQSTLSSQRFFVDLFAADLAHDLAQALFMLGDKIDGGTRELVLAALETRVFKPMRSSFSGEFVGGEHWWLNATNNWNAVCLKGVVGAALTALPSRYDRARFAAAGQHYISAFLSGYPDSGYSTEGSGYWAYGFWHFAVLRAMLYAASNGSVDLLASAKAQSIALYPTKIAMTPPNNMAAFGDSLPGSWADPNRQTLAYLQAAYGNPAVWQSGMAVSNPFPNDSPLVNASMLLTEGVPLAAGYSTSLVDSPGLRSYFSDVGVLVTRSATGKPNAFAATIKASGSKSHGHDDIGSYSIGVNEDQPAGDVGSGRYTEKTFSSQRHTIKWISSYGHPVPVVGGRLQGNAETAGNSVVATTFSDEVDEVSIDLAPSYNLPSGWRLLRTMRNDRIDRSISIDDRFAFAIPQTFEVAITTLGNWRLRSSTALELWQRTEHLHAQIEASGAFDIVGETVQDEGLTFQRIAVRLKDATSAGWVRVRYSRIE